MYKWFVGTQVVFENSMYERDPAYKYLTVESFEHTVDGPVTINLFWDCSFYRPGGLGLEGGGLGNIMIDDISLYQV